MRKANSVDVSHQKTGVVLRRTTTLTRPSTGSSGTWCRCGSSRRSPSSSWTCTATWSPCTKWNPWRKSPTRTWTSTSGSRPTSATCFRTGWSRRTRNCRRSWCTSGVRALTTCRACGTAHRASASSCCSRSLRRCGRRWTSSCWTGRCCGGIQGKGGRPAEESVGCLNSGRCNDSSFCPRTLVLTNTS